MRLVVLPDAETLAETAAMLIRDRVTAKPDLVMAVPAGRTPRRMYERLRDLHARAPVEFSRMRVLCVDELCPPATTNGYFWSQVRREFLSWAAVKPEHCHPFRVDAADLDAMCLEYEETIARLGGLDLVMLGLGPNAHLASNEPGTAFESVTRRVRLLEESVVYMASDGPNVAASAGPLAEQAVTLGLTTIAQAREVVVIVSGRGKREALKGLMDGPIGPDIPATILRDHPCCTVLADRDATG
jgi:glucosamine-6-phosphate deaminase